MLSYHNSYENMGHLINKSLLNCVHHVSCDSIMRILHMLSLSVHSPFKFGIHWAME